MEIGALAKDAAGGYLQVNGDIHQVLNRSRVAAHLRKANLGPEPFGRTNQSTEAERPVVSVVIKRRRRIPMPQE